MNNNKNKLIKWVYVKYIMINVMYNILFNMKIKRNILDVKNYHNNKLKIKYNNIKVN